MAIIHTQLPDVLRKNTQMGFRPSVSELYGYNLPASSFPRYKYFRDLLQRFLPRFRQTIEYGQLPEKSKSETYLCICEDSAKFGNVINVYLQTKNKAEKDIFEDILVKTGLSKSDLKGLKLGTFPNDSTAPCRQNLIFSANCRNKFPELYLNTSKWIDDGDLLPILALFLSFIHRHVIPFIKQRYHPEGDDMRNPKVHPMELQRTNRYKFVLSYSRTLLYQTDDTSTSVCLKQPQSRIQCNLSQNTVLYSASECGLDLYTTDGKNHAEGLIEVIQQILEHNTVAVFQDILDFTKVILTEKTDRENSALARVIKSVERLHFEAKGILRQSSLDLKDTIPVNPEVTNAMKDEIMKLHGVLGCGTISGVFTVFFSGKDRHEQDVQRILQKYKYEDKYRIETEAIISKCADPTHSSGNVIRAKGKPHATESPNYGTLGCFVKIRRQKSEKSLEDNSDLYCITCGHCVDESQELVDIKDRDKFVPFGKIRHILYEDLVSDIAFIEVLQDKVKNCIKSVPRSCGVKSAKKWNFFEESIPVGLPVYKVGASSSITHGVVVSANDVKFVGQSDNQAVPGENIVFIDPVDSLDSETPFFSKSGDSGSIVCTDDKDQSDRVKVVSLLSGSIKSKSRQNDHVTQDEQRESTYSFHLQRSIREAEEAHRFSAEPATENEDTEEGAVGGRTYRR